MKRLLVLFLAIILTLSVVSCAKEPTDDGISTTISSTTEETDLTTEGNELTLDDLYAGPGYPPTTVYFYSIEELQEFIDTSKGTLSEYEEYAKDKKFSSIINPKIAKEMVSNIESHEFPVVASETKIESFYARYNLTQNIFDIMYVIDGKIHRINYHYRENSLPDKSEKTPFKEDVRLGSCSFDLYKSDEWLYGDFIYNSIRVHIKIANKNNDSSSLELFTLTPISSVK